MRYNVVCEKCEGMCCSRMLKLPGVKSVQASGCIFVRLGKGEVC